MEEEFEGIDIERAHPRAIELIPQKFFWDCGDELAPFGSDEGHTAIAEWREWRRHNPEAPVLDCLIWTIESVGEMAFSDYGTALLSREKIEKQVEDRRFDDQQYVFTLDTSVIATAFGQLVDEGKIDPEVKPVAEVAIERLVIWSEMQPGWGHASQYISNLTILRSVLRLA